MQQEIRRHIQRAVDLYGSQRALAQQIGVSQQQVSYLMTAAHNVSAEIAIAIERATKGKVSRKELRPDLFGVKRS